MSTSAIHRFASHYLAYFPREAGRALSTLPLSEITSFLNSLDVQVRKTLLPNLRTDICAHYVCSLEHNQAASTLEQLPENYASAVLQTLPAKNRDSIVPLFSERQGKRLSRLSETIPGTAGALMDAGVFAFHEADSIKNCVQKISEGARTGYYIYIVDENEKLTAVTSMRKLLQHSASARPVLSICKTNVDFIRIDLTAAEIAQHKGWIDHHSLPVVDYEMTFMGVISHETLYQMTHSGQSGDSSDPGVETRGALAEVYALGFGALAASAAKLLHEVKKES